jgi:hypothetical protein
MVRRLRSHIYFNPNPPEEILDSLSKMRPGVGNRYLMEADHFRATLQNFAFCQDAIRRLLGDFFLIDPMGRECEERVEG